LACAVKPAADLILEAKAQALKLLIGEILFDQRLFWASAPDVVFHA